MPCIDQRPDAAPSMTGDQVMAQATNAAAMDEDIMVIEEQLFKTQPPPKWDNMMQEQPIVPVPSVQTTIAPLAPYNADDHTYTLLQQIHPQLLPQEPGKIDITAQAMKKPEQRIHLRLQDRKIKMNNFPRDPVGERTTPLWRARMKLRKDNGLGVMQLLHKESSDYHNKIGRFWFQILETYTTVNCVDDILKIEYQELDHIITRWVSSPVDQMIIFHLILDVFERTGRRPIRNLWPSPQQLEDDRNQGKMKESQRAAKRKNAERSEPTSGRCSPAKKEGKTDSTLGKSIFYYAMIFTAVIAINFKCAMARETLLDSFRDIYFEASRIYLLHPTRRLIDIRIPLKEILYLINATRTEINNELSLIELENSELLKMSEQYTLNNSNHAITKELGNTFDSEKPISFVQCKLLCSGRQGEIANLYRLQSRPQGRRYHVDISTFPFTIFHQSYNDVELWKRDLYYLFQTFKLKMSTRSIEFLKHKKQHQLRTGIVMDNWFHLTRTEPAFCKCFSVSDMLNSTVSDLQITFQKALWTNLVFQKELASLSASITQITNNLQMIHVDTINRPIKYVTSLVKNNITLGNQLSPGRSRRDLVNEVIHVFGLASTSDLRGEEAMIKKTMVNINKIKSFLKANNDSTNHYRKSVSNMIKNIENNFLTLSNNGLLDHINSILLTSRMNNLHALTLLRSNRDELERIAEHYHLLSNGKLPTSYLSMIEGHLPTLTYQSTLHTDEEMVFRFSYFQKTHVFRTLKLKPLPFSVGEKEVIAYDTAGELLIVPRNGEDDSVHTTIRSHRYTQAGNSYYMMAPVPELHRNIDSCTASMYIDYEPSRDDQDRIWCNPYIKRTPSNDFEIIERIGNIVYLASQKYYFYNETCDNRLARRTTSGIEYIVLQPNCTYTFGNDIMDYNPNENDIQHGTMQINSVDPSAFMRLHRKGNDETIQKYRQSGQKAILDEVHFTESQPNMFSWNTFGIEISDDEFIGMTTGVSIMAVLIIVLICICYHSKHVRTISLGLCSQAFHFTKLFFCRICCKNSRENESTMAVNGSNTLDELTSMLETDLSATPIFSLSKIKERQDRQTTPHNNTKETSFKSDQTSATGEKIFIDSHLTDSTSDANDADESYLSESKHPLNKHLKDKDTLRKQSSNEVKAIVHTPPRAIVNPIHTSTPVKRKRLEQCEDNNPWVQYQMVDTNEELTNNNSSLYQTCEESLKSSETSIVHQDVKLKGIEKLASDPTAFVNALKTHFSTKEFIEVRDELLCYMPCRHNNVAATNNIIIHLKTGTFTFLETWCRNCRTLLQSYDLTSTIELIDLAQYANKVRPVSNHEKLIQRLLKLSEGKSIKTQNCYPVLSDHM